ncbi:hypothetical protein D3C78_1464130 [compost metagenome]
MQQHDAVGRQALQGAKHTVEIQASRALVKVRIGVDLEACTFKDRPMVVPGRVADPHLRFREIALEEVGTDF